MEINDVFIEGNLLGKHGRVSCSGGKWVVEIKDESSGLCGLRCFDNHADALKHLNLFVMGARTVFDQKYGLDLR